MDEVLALAFATSALLNAVLAVLAWRRRSATPAATALATAFASLALWSATGVPLNFPVSPPVHAALTYGSFVGILGSVVSLYLLSRVVADPHYRPPRGQVVHLAVVPLLVLAVAATDPWHHLVLTRVTPIPQAPWFEVRWGPLFWVHTLWCYALLTSAFARLLHAWWRGSGPVRRQVGLLLLAGLVCTAGNVVVISDPEVFSGRDLTPLSFTLTALIDAYAVLRVGLLRVVPIARAAVLENVRDAIVVVDAGGTVVDVNAAGRAYLRTRYPDLPVDPVGLPAARFLTARALGDLPGGYLSYELEHASGLHLDVQVTALRDRRGRDLGRVVVGRDVTEVAQLRAQLAEEAVRDPLTGLHNRRHFDTAAAQLLRCAAATGDPVGVLAVDIDHFKRVNDTHGHAVGDLVLVEVARVLAAAERRGDLVARTGGEEFVLLLPGADEEALAVRAEQVRAACAALDVPVAAGTRVRPTVSVGCAVLPHHGADLTGVLAAADRALYAAKAGGRDRVVVATAPPTAPVEEPRTTPAP
ncbi:histidine kinase N-terminal 7TM domain-containing diguanylate cyclase [Kineococcus radiotolerans]|uniref:histidine kinase N-terminal 7TM domain-containing diguanylate cyclase n=1 Tax=Kineococcus radiotolerans TaxID=131568 RepID=UPI00003A4AF8|nr:diguanylate cyclase [Kineococcus radiotolerans]